MKNILKVLVCVLVFGMIFGLCACAKTETPEEPQNNDTENVQNETESKEDETESKPEFKVTVTDANGTPVEGVVVQICKDACVPARTDANGVAVFNIEIEDGHKLSVMQAPEGYTFSTEEIYLEAGATEYTLRISEAE